MKKLVLVVLAAVFAAGLSFADGITFGSWGRGIFIGAANAYVTGDGETSPSNKVVTGTHQSWGGAGPRVGLSIQGSSEKVGFNLDFFADGTNAGLGDNADLWIKPIEQIKLVFGKMDHNELRGDAVFGLWDWDRIGVIGKTDEEGWTFPDIFDVQGFSAIFYPIEGLSFGFAVPIDLTAESSGASKAKTLTDAYIHGAKYGAAYTIANLGTIKAGAVTKSVSDTGAAYLSNSGAISILDIVASFDFTLVDNLLVSVGTVIPAYSYVAANKKSSTDIRAYGRYEIDSFKIHALAGTRIGTYDDNANNVRSEGQFGFTVAAGLDYAFENSVGLFADIHYANGIWMANDSSANKDALTFGLGVTKGFSNGLIGIAFEATTNGGNSGYSRYTQEKPETFAWEIPIRFEYSF